MNARLRLLRPADYKLSPWKNGGGVTNDVLLFPPGSTQDAFDIRLSLAPIVAEGPFSPFPGIDRHITLLSEGRLALAFADGERELKRLEPFYFDSTLAPRSRLGSGPVRVFNVMTRRGRWNAQVMPIFADTAPVLTTPEGGRVALHSVRGTWQVGDRLGSVLVAPGETLVTGEEAILRASCEPEGEAVVAFLSPVSLD